MALFIDIKWLGTGNKWVAIGMGYIIAIGVSCRTNSLPSFNALHCKSGNCKLYTWTWYNIWLSGWWKQSSHLHFTHFSNFNHKQLIYLSDSHGIPLSFSVVTFGVNNKTIHLNIQQFWLIWLRRVSIRSLECKPHYLANIILNQRLTD